MDFRGFCMDCSWDFLGFPMDFLFSRWVFHGMLEGFVWVHGILSCFLWIF